MNIKHMRALALATALFVVSPLFARGALFGWAERGGYNALSSTSGTTISVQRACPSATITVRLAGSVTSATIYADVAGTARANPFTATTAGYWHFFADDGDYDVLVSCGVTYSYTISSMRVTGTGIGVDIRAMGAVCDGTTDDTLAIQAAVNVTGPHNVLWPNKTCKTTDTITVSQHRVNIIGTGMQSSISKFEPTSGGKAAWHFTTGVNSVLYQNSFRGMTVNSADTTFQKFAIRATDTSMLTIEDVAVYPFTGGSAISPFTGGSSVALRLNGREATYVHRFYAASDIPIWIDDNPNFTIDVDHLHVEDFYAAALGTNPIVYISSGVNLTNVTFDGDQIWAVGARGLYWVDTSTVLSSHNLRLDNIRYEQPTARNYVIQIEHNVALYDFTINNSVWGGGTTSDGVKLRKVQRVHFDTFAYNGTGVMLNVDTSVPSVLLTNCFAQDSSTLSLGGLVQVYGQVKISSLSPIHRHSLYQDPTGSNFAAGRCSNFMGQETCAYNGTLANGATFDIPSFGGAISTGLVQIRYRGATKFGSFDVYMDSVPQAFMKATTDTARGTTETGIGNVPGRITVMVNSAANIDLWNQLGESVVYTVWVTQN